MTPTPTKPAWRAALQTLPLLPWLTACAPSMGPTTQPSSDGLRVLAFGDAEPVLDRRVDDLEFGPEGRLYALSSGTGDRRASIRQPGGQWEHIEGIGERPLRGQHWFSPDEGIVVGEGGSAWRLKRAAGAWQRSPIALPPSATGQAASWVDVAFVDAQVGYLCGPSACLRSQDGGLSWARFGSQGGSSLAVGAQQAVLNTSTGASFLLQGEAPTPLRAPNAEGDTANLSQLRFGGGRWWGKQGSSWAFSEDLKAWQRPGPRFEAPGGRLLEGLPDVALPFDGGAYLRNAGGFFYWPGQGLKVSLPTVAQYSASSNDVIAPDGSLYLKSSTGLSRLAPPPDLKALLPS